MGRNWILGLVLFLIISLGGKYLIQFGGFDYWSGVGLVINIITMILMLVIFWVFIIKELPKTKKEVANFEYKGIFNPLFPAIVIGIVAIMFTLGAINGSVPIILTLAAWLVFVLLIFYWLKVKRLLSRRNKK
jgi:preprotein translocase subunit YajC